MSIGVKHLGLLGHGTTGDDGIVPGIHLRWQFASELGFPLGGFRLYRRLSADGPDPSCATLRDARLGIPPREWSTKPDRGPIRLTASDARVERRPPGEGGGEWGFSDGLLAGWPKVKVLVLGEGPVLLALPKVCHTVSLAIHVPARKRVRCQARFAGAAVATDGFLARVDGAIRVVLRANAIDEVKLTGEDAGLVEICIRPVEPCDEEGWEQLDDGFCLPVFYPKRPCKGAEHPDCDDEVVTSRLPEDACDRRRLGGEATRDLVSGLRVLVDPAIPLAQAERFLLGEDQLDECAPPGEPAPTMRVSPLDTLLMAALDPAVARILGLYHVDRPGPRRYDYMVRGEWPTGTLWHLPETLTFDEELGHRRIHNVFPIGPLTFVSRTRPKIEKRPNPWLQTQRALAFVATDDRDWNLPAGFAPLGNDAALIVIFPEPVGEVQVHVSQDIPHVALRAFGAGGQVTAEVRSTRRADVLAVHADDEAGHISRIEITGDRLWIQRIAWGPNRIPHGHHCAFAYDLKVERAKPLQRPRDVVANELPGMVRKEADCQPLRVGATSDARFQTGVSWELPDDTSDDVEVPVRYEVWRYGDDGLRVAATEYPVVVHAPSADDPPYEPPPGWPERQPLFIDTPLEPGRYEYGVVGIDIFGRQSVESDRSVREVVTSAPPPVPTMVEVRYIERGHPSVDAADRAVLINGVNQALRLRWLWGKEALRAAPDAMAFRVYAMPGLPNVLLGKVVNVAADGNSAVLELQGVNEVQAEVLAGRQIVQGTRRIWIRRNDAGVRQGGGVRCSVILLPPRAPSKTRLTKGPCAVALDASVPAQVRGAVPKGNDYEVEFRTRALAAVPASGLVASSFALRGVELRIIELLESQADDDWLQAKCRCTLTSGVGDDLARLKLPLFVPLRLPPPPTDSYRDYGDPTKWPPRLGNDLPRTASGLFELMVRPPVDGESPGLTQGVAGFYQWLNNDVLDKLVVTADEPRSRVTFGVSCVGPNGRESRVSAPMTVTRIFSGPLANPGVMAAPVPAVDPQPLRAGPTNFADKSTFQLPHSWAPVEGWRYELYRALDETVFLVDAELRREQPNRLANVEAFPVRQPDITEHVVNNLNRAAIEAHPGREILLQALASLPGNERAFSKIDLQPITLEGENITFRDDTLDGRAAGQYFYRVRAIGPQGQVGSLQRSTLPVHIRPMPSGSPVFTMIAAGDRTITLRWNTPVGHDFIRYEIRRAGDSRLEKDFRLMEIIDANDPFAYEAPLDERHLGTFKFIDQPDEPAQLHTYHVVGYAISGAATPTRTAVATSACDYGAPDELAWQSAEWVKVDEHGIEHRWEDAGGELAPAIALKFSVASTETLALLERSTSGYDFRPITSWLRMDSYVANQGGSQYAYRDVTSGPGGAAYRVRLSRAGAVRLSPNQRRVEPR